MVVRVGVNLRENRKSKKNEMKEAQGRWLCVADLLLDGSNDALVCELVLVGCLDHVWSLVAQLLEKLCEIGLHAGLDARNGNLNKNQYTRPPCNSEVRTEKGKQEDRREQTNAGAAVDDGGDDGGVADTHAIADVVHLVQEGKEGARILWNACTFARTN